MDEPVKPEDQQLFDQILLNFPWVFKEFIRRQILKIDANLSDSDRYRMVVDGLRSEGRLQEEFVPLTTESVDAIVPKSEAKEFLLHRTAIVNGVTLILPEVRDLPPHIDPMKYTFVFTILVNTMPELDFCDLVDLAEQWHWMSKEQVFDQVLKMREELDLPMPEHKKKPRVLDEKEERENSKDETLVSRDNPTNETVGPCQNLSDSSMIACYDPDELEDSDYDDYRELRDGYTLKPQSWWPRVSFNPPKVPLSEDEKYFAEVVSTENEEEVDWERIARLTQLPGSSKMMKVIYPKQQSTAGSNNNGKILLPRIMCREVDFTDHLLRFYPQEQTKVVSKSFKTPESLEASVCCADSKKSEKLMDSCETSPPSPIASSNVALLKELIFYNNNPKDRAESKVLDSEISPPSSKDSSDVSWAEEFLTYNDSPTIPKDRAENKVLDSPESPFANDLLPNWSPERLQSFFAPLSAEEIAAARAANQESDKMVVSCETPLPSALSVPCSVEGKADPATTLSTKKLVRGFETPLTPEKSSCSSVSSESPLRSKTSLPEAEDKALEKVVVETKPTTKKPTSEEVFVRLWNRTMYNFSPVSSAEELLAHVGKTRSENVIEDNGVSELSTESLSSSGNEMSDEVETDYSEIRTDNGGDVGTDDGEIGKLLLEMYRVHQQISNYKNFNTGKRVEVREFWMDEVVPRVKRQKGAKPTLTSCTVTSCSKNNGRIDNRNDDINIKTEENGRGLISTEIYSSSRSNEEKENKGYPSRRRRRGRSSEDKENEAGFTSIRRCRLSEDD